MTEIRQLQQRMAQALARVQQSVAALPLADPAVLEARDAEIARLTADLDAAQGEGADTAQLRADFEAQTAELDAMKADLERSSGALEELGTLRAQLAGRPQVPDAEDGADVAPLDAQLEAKDRQIQDLKEALSLNATEHEAQLTACNDELDKRLARMETEHAEALEQARAEPTAEDAELESLRSQVADTSEALQLAQERTRQLEDQLAGNGVTAEEAAAKDARIAELEASMEESERVNADLGERLKTLQQTVERSTDEATKREQARAMYIEELDATTQRLKQSNADLSAANADLCAALEAQTADAELINRAMEAELDALRTAREAEAAEVDAVMADIKPIIEGA